MRATSENRELEVDQYRVRVRTRSSSRRAHKMDVENEDNNSNDQINPEKSPRRGVTKDLESPMHHAHSPKHVEARASSPNHRNDDANIDDQKIRDNHDRPRDSNEDRPRDSYDDDRRSANRRSSDYYERRPSDYYERRSSDNYRHDWDRGSREEDRRERVRLESLHKYKGRGAMRYHTPPHLRFGDGRSDIERQ